MYIKASEYVDLTGRDLADATDARIKRASIILDSRIGYYKRNDDGYKLTMDSLPGYQQDAVKEWVAQMVAFLADNNDQAPSAASLTFGRFSVTEHGQKGQNLPESMALADAVLVSSGLINRKATLKHRSRDVEVL